MLVIFDGVITSFGIADGKQILLSCDYEEKNILYSTVF